MQIMYACHSRHATIKCNTRGWNNCSRSRSSSCSSSSSNSSSEHTFQFVGHSTKKTRGTSPRHLTFCSKQTDLRWWWRWHPAALSATFIKSTKGSCFCFPLADASAVLFASQIKNSAQDWAWRRRRRPQCDAKGCSRLLVGLDLSRFHLEWKKIRSSSPQSENSKGAERIAHSTQNTAQKKR